MSLGKRLSDDVEIRTMPAFGIGGLSEPGIYIFIGGVQLTDYQGDPITLGRKHVEELFCGLAYELSGERYESMKDVMDRFFPQPLPSDEV